MINSILSQYSDIYKIDIDLPGAGFGAILLTIINQLRFAERRNFYPVVVMSGKAGNAFFDHNFGSSMWRQYFEEVNDLPFEELNSFCQSTSYKVFTLPSQEAIEVSETHPESVYTYPFGKWRLNPPRDLKSWYDEQRAKGRETVGRYVKPKGHIWAKVNELFERHVNGQFVLGIHIRGTDLHYAPPVSPPEYFDSIDSFIEEYRDLKIFLATDQHQYLEVFKNRYGDRLFHSSCFRSDNAVAPFNRNEISPYQKGEEVLVDILSLSKTNHLIRGGSNVGEIAMYFNPLLECTDLAIFKTKSFGQSYDKSWDNMTNKPAWDLVKTKGLTTLSQHNNTQSFQQKLIYEIRKILKKTRVSLGRIRQSIPTSKKSR